MASADILCKKLLNVKHTVVESHDFYTGADGAVHLRIKVVPMRGIRMTARSAEGAAPVTTIRQSTGKFGADFGFHKIQKSRVTPTGSGAQSTVSLRRFRPLGLSRQQFYQGFRPHRCMARRIHPEECRRKLHAHRLADGRELHLKKPAGSRAGASRRLDGLARIGIDETSYRKGHKYITVIVNHDTNTVVWVADGHGKSVLEQFYLGAERWSSWPASRSSPVMVPAGLQTASTSSRRTVSAASIHSMSLNGLWTPGSGPQGPLARGICKGE